MNSVYRVLVVDKIEPAEKDVKFYNPLLEVLKKLSNKGVDVHIVSTVNKDEGNMHYHDVRKFDGNRLIRNLFSYSISIPRIMLLVWRQNFDIIYFRSAPSRIVALLIKWIHNVGFICEVHGIEQVEYEHSYQKESFLKNIFNRVKSYLQIKTIKEAHGVRVVTNELENYLIDLGIDPHRISVIENGVNIDVFNSNYTIDDICKKIDCSIFTNKKIIIWEGYFYPWQGVEYLIDAAKLLVVENMDILFLIVGDGPMKQHWLNQISELGLTSYFHFTGAVPYDLVPYYILLAKIGVSPEIKDKRNEITGGSSLKLFEYLACGVPSIVGDLSGNKKIIEASNSGVVIDAVDSQEFANSINYLLSNPDVARNMGLRGQSYVSRYYSWDNIAEQIYRLLVSTIHGI